MSNDKPIEPGINGETFELSLNEEFTNSCEDFVGSTGRVIKHVFEGPIMLMTCVDTFVTKDIFVQLTTGIDYYVHEILQDARGVFVYVINDVGEKRCYNIDRFKTKD